MLVSCASNVVVVPVIRSSRNRPMFVGFVCVDLGTILVPEEQKKHGWWSRRDGNC